MYKYAYSYINVYTNVPARCMHHQREKKLRRSVRVGTSFGSRPNYNSIIVATNVIGNYDRTGPRTHHEMIRQGNANHFFPSFLFFLFSQITRSAGSTRIHSKSLRCATRWRSSVDFKRVKSPVVILSFWPIVIAGKSDWPWYWEKI